MKSVNIDLGDDSPCCVSETKPAEKYYPTVTYTSDTEMELPDSGKMLVEFKKVESRESNRGDKEQYSCTFEVRKIISVGGEVESDDESNAGKAKNEAGDALDKLRDDYVKSKGKK